MNTLASKRTLALGILAGALALALAAPFAAYAEPRLVGADRGLVVLTGSMEPSIEPGDVVLVAETDIDEVQVGDVVTFNPHPGVEKTYTHRVVDITHDKRGTVLTTKGDANERPDPMQVDDAMLVGTVEHRIPTLGKAIAALQGPLTPLTLVVLSILTAGYEITNLLEHAEADEGDPDGRSTGTRFPVVTDTARFPVVRRR